MLRAVLDTNVIISAFIRPEGPPGKILVAWLEGAFELVMSAGIAEEVRGALRYPRVRSRIALEDDELDLRVDMIEVLADPVEPVPLRGPISSDPDDDLYIATALAGRAQYVVTGDDDLLSLGEYERIRFLKPRAFLDLLQSASEPRT